MKNWCKFQKCKETLEKNVFGVLEYGMWIGYELVENSPLSNEKIEESCCNEDFSSALDPKICWPWNGVLKQGLLDV